MLPVTDTIVVGRPPRTAVISDSIIDEIISELKRFPLQSRDLRTSAAFPGCRWRRRHDSSSAIPPSASLYNEPKTITSKLDLCSRPSGRFWSAACGAKLPFVGMSAHGGKADFPVARPDFW